MSSNELPLSDPKAEGGMSQVGDDMRVCSLPAICVWSTPYNFPLSVQLRSNVSPWQVDNDVFVALVSGIIWPSNGATGVITRPWR